LRFKIAAESRVDLESVTAVPEARTLPFLKKHSISQ